MPIRVLLVISNLEYGGAQRQVVETANCLDPEAFDVHVCSLSECIPLAGQLRASIPVYVIEKRAKFDWTTVFRLALLFRQIRINIVHAFLFDAELASRLAGFFSFSNVTVIGSERNSGHSVPVLHKFFNRITRHLVSVVVANSTAGYLFHKSTYKLSDNRYRTIHNGVNIRRFRPTPIAFAREAIGLSEHGTVAGVFASFKPQKNLTLVLESLIRLKQTHQGLRVLFVGDVLSNGDLESSAYGESFRKMIAENGLESNCILLGNREEVERFYPACDFTILPSNFEGTPNSALESMACGVPVIATMVGDNNIIIKHEETGLLVEANNADELASAIHRLIIDKPLLGYMKNNCRNHIKRNFASDVLARRLGDVYREFFP